MQIGLRGILEAALPILCLQAGAVLPVILLCSLNHSLNHSLAPYLKILDTGKYQSPLTDAPWKVGWLPD